MNKKFFIIVLSFLFVNHVFSQDLSTFHLYHPEEDAAKAIDAAVKKAKATNRHVFIMIGGNWCIWCARFNQFMTTDKQIDSLVNANYVVYHLNYSKENKNTALLAKYGYPQRFGFPVFLILDGEGNRLHTQNSGYLEEGKGYNRDKVIDFFASWTPAALDPAQYKE
jgi:thioredoxin-related protein